MKVCNPSRGNYNQNQPGEVIRNKNNGSREQLVNTSHFPDRIYRQIWKTNLSGWEFYCRTV
jgi:hypothetical protein